MNKITAATAYADKAFQFLDDKDRLLGFSRRREKVGKVQVSLSKEKNRGVKPLLPFALKRSSFIEKGMMKHLKLEKEASIISCVTLVPNGENHILYFNESIGES